MDLQIPSEVYLDKNITNDFRRFKLIFEVFMIANEKKLKTEEQKVALLLNVIGESGIQLYNNIKLTRAERNDYKKVLKKFDEYINPKTKKCRKTLQNFEEPTNPRKNEMYERFVFFRRKQLENEPFDTFYNDLQMLATSCGFDNQDNKLIRDAIVLQIYDKKLQKKLLSMDDLTLEQTVQISRAHESTQGQLVKVQNKIHEENREVTVIQENAKTTEMNASEPFNRLCEQPTALSCKEISSNDDLGNLETFNAVDVQTQQIPVNNLNENVNYTGTERHVNADSLKECNVCGKVFQSNKNLKAHIRTHLIRKLECRFCEKIYATKTGLDKHVARHFGDLKLFECAECDKKFNSKFSLYRHVLNHNKDSCPFVCDICGFRSAEKLGIVKHQRIKHFGVKNFHCDECSKCFFLKSDLVKHKKIHSGLKEYTCHVCEKDFNRPENLKRHLRTHSLANFKCKACGIIFNHFISYRKHMISKHEPTTFKVPNWKDEFPKM